jgi:hypothetical protein
MKLIRWAAVAVTALFALMNLGAALDPEQQGWVRAVGAPLALAGVVAAVGLARDAGWGRPAVIAVGAINVASGIAALIADEPGGAVGIVVGGLAVILGALSGQEGRSRLAT